MKILKEAFNYATQKEKMYGYETGTRALSGLSMMSDEKLKYNLMVCAKEGYERAKKLILMRMAEQDLFVGPTARLYYNFTFFDQPSDIEDYADWIFSRANGKSVKEIINSIYAQGNNYPLTAITKQIFIALLVFLANGDETNAAVLKDELCKLGFNLTAIKNAINKVLADKDAMTALMTAKAKSNEPLSEDIEKHETLNPKLWTKDNILKPEVEEKIKLIVNEFLDGLEKDEIVFDIVDVVLVGSNCSYNYTKDSDLDIHILVNMDNSDCPKNLYDKVYSAYRTIFNNRLDIDFYGIPVEIYVEDKNNTNISNGKYSVVNKKWIKEPVAEDIPEIDQEKFDKEFKVWEDRYNEVINMK